MSESSILQKPHKPESTLNTLVQEHLVSNQAVADLGRVQLPSDWRRLTIGPKLGLVATHAHYDRGEGMCGENRPILTARDAGISPNTCRSA